MLTQGESDSRLRATEDLDEARARASFAKTLLNQALAALAEERDKLAAQAQEIERLRGEIGNRAKYEIELRSEGERLRAELRDARLDARILAHSYEHDSRPPANVVTRSLSWTIRGEEATDEPR